jgi:hypothetical protein
MRRVTKELTFSFEGAQYLIEGHAGDVEKIGPHVEIEHRIDGTMVVVGASGQLSFCAL